MTAIALLALSGQHEIPSRVNCEVALQLAESKIPGAGRGIFVLQDVKEGALLFEVPDVLFSIISKECIATTCDKCFAHKSSYGQTDPRPDIRFTVCETCNVVYYCSDACKQAAWDAYHKFECPNLLKILSTVPGGEGIADPRSEEFRTMIRILSLQDAGMISDKDWEEIMGLRPQTPMLDGRPRFIRHIGEMLALISEHEITKLSMADVEKIIRAYFNNRSFIQLWTPCTLPLTNQNRFRTVEVPVGECLEPFFSMINHACDPNCVWLSHGRTLQVRAERDIAAGEEITICYGWSETLQDRQIKLAGWIGKCSCSICINPPREPTGRLRDQITRLVTARGAAATPSQARAISLQFAIRQMERAGFGLNAWPNRHLYSQLFRCRVGQYDGPEMLKTWLKLYYFVEPAMRPHECLSNRNRSLAVLAYLLDLNDPTYATLKPYPDEVIKLAPYLYYQLRVRLLHDVRQCHSKESYCVKFEEEKYEKDFGHLEREAESVGPRSERDYIPYWASEISTWAFVIDMNDLLVWAGLPALCDSQLLSMQVTMPGSV
ncbi:hypothetical protein BKA65DRAFT_552115 [Rhexocercosporidium sp. MPI-PUGE-AT-0058]|nr:hypothetical protein BKA65DRAFT_552115 [Rhexocercosporidium sp. MPI-PUGE-AT-0058]